MKRLLSILLALAVIAALAGCSQLSANAQPEPEPDTSGQTVLYGKVKAANGNEVTLALGTMGGTGGANFAGDRPSGDAAAGEPPADLPEGFSPPAGASGNMPEGFTPPANASGNMPSGGRGQGGNRQNSAGGAEQSGSAEPIQENASDNTGQSGAFPGGGNMTAGSTSLEYTGEEATFQIPVTAAVTTGEGESARVVSFTQIGYKNILKLTLDEKGNILSVVILQ